MALRSESFLGITRFHLDWFVCSSKGSAASIFYLFLCSFAFENCNFSNWWTHCQGYSFTPDVAVWAVLHVSQRQGMLLCVDEILKAESCLPIVQRQLGNLLNTMPNIFILTTTLDETINAAEERRTGSGRNIRCVPIGPLDAALLPVNFPTLSGEKARIAAQLISSCNGHARSLQFVSEAINDVVQQYQPETTGEDSEGFFVLDIFFTLGVLGFPCGD